LRFLLHLIFIAAFVFTGPSLAQKLVDPNSVAPEFRDAAEKRRAEQIKVVECNRKANEAKVLPRDRTALPEPLPGSSGRKVAPGDLPPLPEALALVRGLSNTLRGNACVGGGRCVIRTRVLISIAIGNYWLRPTTKPRDWRLSIC
jgi:hypothetical protein